MYVGLFAALVLANSAATAPGTIVDVHSVCARASGQSLAAKPGSMIAVKCRGAETSEVPAVLVEDDDDDVEEAGLLQKRVISIIGARVNNSRGGPFLPAVEEVEASETIRRTSRVRAEAALEEGAPTFCVFSRISGQELPYIESFLKHYAEIGVQTFYFLSNHPGDHDAIASKCVERAPRGTRVVLHSVPDIGANEMLQTDQELLSQVSEDFVIGVDTDEYWSLPASAPTLHTLVTHMPAAVYLIPWVMIVHDELFDEPQRELRLMGRAGSEVKWMAKRSMLRSIGIHVPGLNQPPKPGDVVSGDAVGSMVHYWGRTFLDQLNKVMSQYGMVKLIEGPVVGRQLLESGRLPERLKLLAFLTMLPRLIQVNMRGQGLMIDHDLERALAARYLGLGLNNSEGLILRAYGTYTEFKARLRPFIDRGDYPSYPGHSLVQIQRWVDTVYQQV